MPEKKVLLVEDELPLLQAIEKKMVTEGLTVVKARTVLDALKLLQSDKEIASIWLDHYLLGKETGLDLVATVKAEDSVWRALPIFVVSNTASEDKVRTYLHLGVDKYFVKSNFRLDEIVQTLKEVMYG
jgi:DNA-binding response OmpR family regulator